MITPDQHQRVSSILKQIHQKVLNDDELTVIERECWNLRVKRGEYYAPRENVDTFLKLIEEHEKRK